MLPNPPSNHIAVPPPSYRPPQITPQKSNHSLDTVSSDGQGESAWVGESENARPYDSPRTTIQSSPPDTIFYRSTEHQGSQSSGRVLRIPSHRSTAASEPPPRSIDPQPLDPSNPYDGQVRNQVYNRADRNASRRYANGRGSRRLTIRGLISVIADVGVELDLHGVLDDNDERNHRSGDRRNNRGASRMLPALITPYFAADISGVPF